MNICTEIKQLLPAQPCVLCGSMSHDGLWCAACDNALPYLAAAHCPTCALPTPNRHGASSIPKYESTCASRFLHPIPPPEGEGTHESQRDFHDNGEICGQCLTHPPLFTHTTAVFSYSFPLDKLIQEMKYGGQISLAIAFAEKLAQRIDRNNLPDCIIPMPLHPAKLRERGFNQSQLLAARIARELGIVLLPEACRRVRDTPPQTALPWKERKKNVRDAFCCDDDLAGKRVALVDDVLTTGASLNALAKAVQKRGAVDISVWVVARTIPHLT